MYTTPRAAPSQDGVLTAQDEAMAAQRKAFLSQYLLPLTARSDPVTFVQKPFGFLCGRQPSKFGSERMLGGQKGLLTVKDRRVAKFCIVASSHPKSLEMYR